LASTRRGLLALCLLAVSACATTGGAGWYAGQVGQGTALEVPFVRQASPAGCGMAALASVMAYYETSDLAQQALLERYPPASPDGYSLGELRDIARAHELAAFVVPGDMAFLRSQLARGRPVIVPLQVEGAMPLLSRALDTRYDHYLVVSGMDDEGRKVIAIDPARGPVALDFDDFAASWARMNHAVLLVGLAQTP
jgi:ABC-type bacteriocin/lantibiotic exporter with double-glycine peptidase domain